MVLYALDRLLRLVQDMTTAGTANAVLKGSKALDVHDQIVQVRVPKSAVRQLLGHGEVRRLR